MKIKLIQSGGFVGKSKTAEEELATYPASLQQFVQQVFSQQPAKKDNPAQPDKSRDKESYTLEFNSVRVPLNAVPANDDMDQLVKKLKANLKYKKD